MAPLRIGSSPVSSAARLGAHDGDATKACEKVMPSAASRAMFGVRDVLAAVDRAVRPAKIVGEEEDDVRPVGREALGGCEGQDGGREQRAGHEESLRRSEDCE